MAKRIPHRILILAILAAGSSPVQAGEEEQAALCRDDVMRLCITSIPDRGRIVGCMRAQRASLSAGCRAILDSGLRDGSGRPSAAAR